MGCGSSTRYQSSETQPLAKPTEADIHSTVKTITVSGSPEKRNPSELPVEGADEEAGANLDATPGVARKTSSNDEPDIVQIRHFMEPLDKFVFLKNLQARDQRQFFRLLMEYTNELMPIVYTPTVGAACQQYHTLQMKTQGLYLSKADKGKFLEKLKAWPNQDIKAIVVTDGERILGLGDLGTGGMGISEGKILLYTVIAGIPPKQCLPICLDLGTNRQSLIDDPTYPGIKSARPGPAEFDELLEEFMGALREWKDHTLLQFEDFGNGNAFRLLSDFRDRQCCFNDDIQGTACVTLAGILAGLRASEESLLNQRILFLGAGEAGTGIGELIALCLQEDFDLSIEEARQHCFFMDSKGLVTKSRTDLQHHKLPFAHDVPPVANLLEAVKSLKPTVLIGVSTIAGAFTKEVVEEMMNHTDRPLIFPLSNPTSCAECTYEDAFNWSEGKAIFASGSPFQPITTPSGDVFTPAQANNAYVFPALGYAAILTKCRSMTDKLFLIAANTLGAISSIEDINKGFVFPPFTSIKEVSNQMITEVGKYILSSNMGTQPEDLRYNDWEAFIAAKSYPKYNPGA